MKFKIKTESLETEFFETEQFETEQFETWQSETEQFETELFEKKSSKKPIEKKKEHLLDSVNHISQIKDNEFKSPRKKKGKIYLLFSQFSRF